MSEQIIKSAYGLTFSRSFIFDRVLSIISLLYWKPEDIGLSRVHFVKDVAFPTKKGANTYAKENGYGGN